MSQLYYRVGPSIWNEPWNDDERLMAVYLLTCPHRNTEGLFKLPKAYIVADLGWEPARSETAFNGLLQCGFIEYDEAAKVVWIVKAIEWQPLVNENQAKASAKAMLALPSTPLFNRFRRVAEKRSRTLAKHYKQAFGLALAQAPTPAPQSPTATPPPRAPVIVDEIGQVA